jgi:hypothetical protein
MKARFVPTIKEAGRYEVVLWFTPSSNRATNTPVVVHGGKEEKTIKVNQKQPLKDGKPWSLGVFEFAVGTDGYVEIHNGDTDGHVIIDAVQWIPVK